ncbi:MAG: J domain-containing protein [Pyrinomonadaceae bacterium]
MTPQTELEIKRSFFAHTFAELMAEIRQARLNGSLRISDKDRKCVVYFKGGSVGVFAFSNARASRLFDILLRQNKLSKDDLTQIPNFTNDLELAAFLRDKKFLAKTDSDKLFAEQIEGILVDIFAWETGEWTFSSLARIRDGLAFKVNTTALLVDYGRCLAVDKMLGRFRSLEERFSRPEMLETDVSLTPDEGFVHSRSNDRTLTAAGLVSVAAMSESAALQAIYTLWLGGMLTRNDWQPAFSFGTVAAMKNTRLELKTEARLHDAPEPVIDETSVVAAKAPPKEPEIVITLEEYLERVENAATHYDILGVDIKAEADELKREYFSMVRMFHPDRYHAKGGERSNGSNTLLRNSRRLTRP